MVLNHAFMSQDDYKLQLDLFTIQQKINNNCPSTSFFCSWLQLYSFYKIVGYGLNVSIN